MTRPVTFPWGRYPVLGICGWSGSGKTTLLEALLQRPAYRALRIAVVKHDAHGVSVDRPGKDSDRLYQAGADVLLNGPDQSLLRLHPYPDWSSLATRITDLLSDHDLVLVEGHKDTPLPKLWLSAADGADPPASVVHIEGVLARDGARVDAADAFIGPWLQRRWRSAPLCAGLLVGGHSRRMGSPKHLLLHQGHSWLHRSAQVLAGQVDQIVVLGNQPLPPDTSELLQLADVREAQGPVAGLLSAQRWAPLCNWLMVACDLPQLSPEAIEWLKEQRQPGRWVILPEVVPGRAEPLLAYYDLRARALLEDLAHREIWAPRTLVGQAQVAQPKVPAALRAAWRNVNTPEEAKELL